MWLCIDFEDLFICNLLVSNLYSTTFLADAKVQVWWCLQHMRSKHQYLICIVNFLISWIWIISTLWIYVSHMYPGKLTLSHQALPYLICKIWRSTFKKLPIRQNQALPYLISKIWRSTFKKLSIRQNQALPYLISKIWRSTFKKLSICQNQALPYLSFLKIKINGKVIKSRILQRMKRWQQYNQRKFW